MKDEGVVWPAELSGYRTNHIHHLSNEILLSVSNRSEYNLQYKTYKCTSLSKTGTAIGLPGKGRYLQFAYMISKR